MCWGRSASSRATPAPPAVAANSPSGRAVSTSRKGKPSTLRVEARQEGARFGIEQMRVFQVNDERRAPALRLDQRLERLQHILEAQLRLQLRVERPFPVQVDQRAQKRA